MYEQQEEDIVNPDVEDQFVFHPPARNSHQTTKNNLDKIKKITAKCEQICHEVMDERVKQFGDSLMNLIKDNFKKDKNMTKDSKEKWKLIFPISLKKNQQPQLEKFIRNLVELVSQIGEEEEDDEPISETSKQMMIFKKSRKINIVIDQIVEIRKIALKLHQRYKGINTENDLMIYCTTTITNLSPNNSYIFEEGLTECNCMLLLPTYSTFQLYNYFINSKIELIPVYLYHHRELFCEFFYRLITHRQIMAYLPPQSTSLIFDFDLYPISYMEGARRLIFCIQKMLILHQQRNIKLQYVEIQNLFTIIEKAMRRSFRIFYEGQTTDKNILNILSDEEHYNPFDRFLNKIEFFRYQDGGQKTEDELMKGLRERISRYLEREEDLKNYAAFLDPNNKDRKIKKKSKDCERFKMTDFNENLQHHQKQFLEKNLTLIIKHHTSKIRTQARKISWEDIKFTERIRPMIPYDIHESVKKSKVHAEILDFIEAQISISLARVMQKFCVHQDKSSTQMSFGELIYYLKDLELYGLIDIVYRGITPRVSPCFFPKARYANKPIK